MYIITYLDCYYGIVESLVGDRKSLLSIVGNLEKLKIKYKVSYSGGILLPKHFGMNDYEYWLSANDRFD